MNKNLIYNDLCHKNSLTICHLHLPASYVFYEYLLVLTILSIVK